MTDIHKVLKTLRLNKGLSLREAANRSGISHSYIDALEKGSHPRTKTPIQPSPDSLKSLATAYDEDYMELMRIAGYVSEENAETHNGPDALSPDDVDIVLKELVKKYNIDLTDPNKANKLEQIIQLVFQESKKQ